MMEGKSNKMAFSIECGIKWTMVDGRLYVYDRGTTRIKPIQSEEEWRREYQGEYISSETSNEHPRGCK